MDNRKKLGVILSDKAGQGLTHDYFAEVIEGFRQGCEMEGYSLIFLNNNREKNGGVTYLQQAQKSGCAGVLIACMEYSEEIRELLDSETVCAVIDEDYDNCICVRSDNVRGMESLVEYLVGMGHRRIAMICGDNNPVSATRLHAFQAVCKRHGIAIPEEYIRQGKFRDMKKAAYHTEKLLKLSCPPTCIMYPDDYAAIGGINVLRARGAEIPGDMSITGYDGNEILMRYEPRLTTVRQDAGQIGRLAIQQLLYFVQHPQEKEYPSTVVEATLEQGSTVGKVY